MIIPIINAITLRCTLRMCQSFYKSIKLFSFYLIKFIGSYVDIKEDKKG